MDPKRINELKKRKGYTNRQLAEMTGISLSSLDKITAGDNDNPKLSTIKLLSAALGCPINYLIGEDEEFDSEEAELTEKYRSLDSYGKETVKAVLDKEYERVCGQEAKTGSRFICVRFNDYAVSAGTGDILNDFEQWNTVLVPLTAESRKADFILRVDGDSMEDMYHDGDYVLVRRCETVERGEIGIFSVNGKGYIKKLGKNELISLNKKYSPIPLDADSICFGKVLGITRIYEE